MLLNIHKSKSTTLSASQRGFTIIELMIATAIFSFVLLIASSAVIAVGRLYHKSITSARTQEITRHLMEDVSRSIQFSKILPQEATPLGDNTRAYCIGEDRYSYRLNNQVHLDPPITMGLRHDIRPNLSECVPQNSGGKELLANNMRLLDFSITGAGTNRSSIAVKIAYGDNDLLTSYDDNGNPNGQAASAALCKGGAGSDFCATAELATVVNKRVKSQ